jgi:hypothetical protein
MAFKDQINHQECRILTGFRLDSDQNRRNFPAFSRSLRNHAPVQRFPSVPLVIACSPDGIVGIKPNSEKRAGSTYLGRTNSVRSRAWTQVWPTVRPTASRRPVQGSYLLPVWRIRIEFHESRFCAERRYCCYWAQ